MARLSAAAAVLVLLAGVASTGAAAGAGRSLRVGLDPFRIAVLAGGRTVVSEDVSARLRFELRANHDVYSLTHVIAVSGSSYRVATSEHGRTATVSVRPTANGVAVAVALHPSSGVLALFDSFDTRPGEHFLGGGERPGVVDLSGQVLPVEVSDHCSYAPVPFFLSSAGWGLRLASENVAALAFPNSAGGAGCQSDAAPACVFPPLGERAEVCVEGATLVEELYVGSLAQVLGDYESATGRPALPPPSELELIKWRDVVTAPAQVLEDVRRLQAARIPIGWVELDNPWEPCIGELSFDRTRIPDPARLIAQVHALGVHFMLWVSPKAICPAGYPAGGLLGPPNDRVLDLRNATVRAVFEARLRHLVALGIDGVKADRGDEVDLEPDGASLTNEYPLLYARAVLAALPRGSAAIFRAATVGSQHVIPGLWGGDQEQTWAGLQAAIVEAQTAAMSGFPTWGSDIGGYAPASLTPELFERWAQLGAVSPVMEVGGAGPNATPWLLGAGAMGVLRDAAVLHYELYPYLYGLLQRGLPVLAPVAYGFPKDAHAWTSPLELLVGPDLFAAPVTGPGVTPSVYLPPGAWVDLYAGTRVAGGGPTFTRPTPDSQFPLYARAGSVFPFNLRTATGSWWGTDQLVHRGRAGFLATDGAKIELRGLPAKVQIFVPAHARPTRVTLGGRPVAWSWNPGPLPGVVIRLRGPAVQGRIVVSGP